MNRLLLLPCLLFCLACGDDERAPTVAPAPNTGGTSAGGFGGGTSLGGEGGEDSGGDTGTAGSGNPLAPIVEITAPVAVDDPAMGGVLLEDTVLVVCSARPADAAGAKPVNPSSVFISAVHEDGTELTSAPGTPSHEPDHYESSVILPREAHGSVAFRCTAADTSVPPLVGSAEVTSFVDAGPEITVSEPAPGSAFAIERPIPFSFTVAAQPLTAGDEAAAAVSSVTLVVNGVEIEALTEEPPGTYTASVDLGDERLFPTPPVDSVPVLIRAVNSRDPEPKEYVLGYDFTLDGEGPTIEILSPEKNDIVAGDVNIDFDVKDDADIVERSIVVRVGTVEFRFDPAERGTWPETDTGYRLKFDTTDPRFNAGWQLTVNIRAEDVVGNEGRASRTFLLDNHAPFVHLDPAPVREFSDLADECSLAFDPLGPAAANDGDAILRVNTFRALVWDQTNIIPGSHTGVHSGADPTSVSLWLQADSGQPILEDEDRDGACDTIVQSPTVYHNELLPIEATGTAERGPGGPAALGCEYDTSNNEDGQLRTVCDSRSDMYRVIDHSVVGPEPVVYGLANVGGTCTGGQWEIGTLVTREGFACLAAEASDDVGNYAFSPPLAVCVSDGVGPEPPCASSSVPLPSCVDNCTVDRRDSPVPKLPDGSWPARLEE